MRRERYLFAAIAVALVLLRSVVPTVYEGFFFDSDQAIVGLMARHLSTLQTFPLYYYGLNYLLGVQAWVIAPFFWIFRSSVAVMRIPLIALNVLVAVWLIVAFGKRLALRPAVAFIAALPFLIPTPAVGSHLLETAGASIEPFVYILALWELRHRPFAFGAVLAIGGLHREFTFFALPALVIVEAVSGELASRSNIQRALKAAAGFALVYLVVDDLKMHLLGGTVTLQAAAVRGQMCLDPSELAQHSEALLVQALPGLLGGRPMPLSAFRMNSALVCGSLAALWIIGAALGLMVARLMLQPARHATGESGFGVYLALVGLFTACAYPLSCNVALGAPPLFRYLLLALLLPVGCAATFMARERSTLLRSVAAGLLVLWGAMNLIDNVRLVVAAAADPPPSEHRVLADYLVAHRIRYARAIYWDAYIVDFLSRERVIVAAVDVERIPKYQRAIDEHPDATVTLRRLPCEGGERVASWCVQ